MVEKKEKMKCESCKSTNMFIDRKGGEVVCKDCGVVSSAFMYWKNEIYEK